LPARHAILAGVTDGRHLIFAAYRSGATPPELRRIDADGRNQVGLGRDQANTAPTQR
jgi:hypothetical protein